MGREVDLPKVENQISLFLLAHDGYCGSKRKNNKCKPSCFKISHFIIIQKTVLQTTIRLIVPDKSPFCLNKYQTGKKSRNLMVWQEATGGRIQTKIIII